MIKVLQLRSSFDPGGTETTLLNLFNYPQQCFQIHFVLLRDGSLINQLDESNGNRYYKWFRKKYLDFSVIRKMIRLINDEGITIVHTHQGIELLYAVCLKAIKPKLKIIYHNHIMFASRDWTFYMERSLSHHFAKTITVSEAAKNEMVTSFGFSERKVSVLYNAVKLNINSSATAPTVDLDLDKSRINIVMVANFVWGKDHETIFKAYNSYIREQLPQVSFYFIGRKTDISERLVEKYLTEDDIKNKRMVLCGAIAHAKLLVPSFDMVTMSCFSETFNQALVEAASFGKVILASDIPVFKELSNNGQYFHHFKTGNADEYFAKLKQLVDNLDQEQAATHPDHFKNKFSFDKLVDEHCQLYLSQLNGQKKDKSTVIQG